MKITPFILSIPPYLSTTWENISSLHTQEMGHQLKLVAVLQDGSRVEIPNLGEKIVTVILEAHARYTKLASLEQSKKITSKTPFNFLIPLGEDGEISDSLGQTLQHNPEQSDLPPLPPSFLEKLSTLTRAFSDEDLNRLPTPEPNCHCIYCQVIHAIRGDTIEEEVSEEDLRFRNWDVKSTETDKLYLVTNPLDENEYYHVFLGEPLGCTCGQKNCEHIHAVLNT